MQRLKIVVFFLLWCMTTLVSAAETALCDKIAQPYLANVIVINTCFDDGSCENGFGFVIGERKGNLYVVTALHVVVQEENTTKIEVTFQYEQGIATHKAAMLDFADEKLDIVLLKVAKPKDYQWRQHAYCPNYARNDNVCYIGRTERWYIPTDNEVGKLKTGESSSDGFISSSMPGVIQGTSGAPLIGQYGIVGMIIQVNPEIGDVKAVDIDVLRKFIDENYPKTWNLELCSVINSVSGQEQALLNALQKYKYTIRWTGGMAANFGIYQTKKIKKVLVNDKTVTIHYEGEGILYNLDGQLDGLVKGNTVSGNWRENVLSSGQFSFTFNDDFSKAEGWWTTPGTNTKNEWMLIRSN